MRLRRSKIWARPSVGKASFRVFVSTAVFVAVMISVIDRIEPKLYSLSTTVANKPRIPLVGQQVLRSFPNPSLQARGRGKVSGLSVRVSGNELVSAHGRRLRLVGVNRSGSEYMCVLGQGIFDGPVNATSISAMKAWRINAVRVPLNEDCWLGINGVDPSYAASFYRSSIEEYVGRLNAAGLYVILDVHWSASGTQQSSGQQNMLDASHGYTLWRSIATTFMHNPAVLFDLYNEPHNLGGTTEQNWRCWAYGCNGYAGMKALVAEVRATGAKNVVLIAGLGWAAEDTEWLRYEPNDPLHQLAVSFHVYGDHGLCTTVLCWNRTLLPIAKHVPVVADEFGEMRCGEPIWLVWLNSWMTYATVHHFSMLAWTWDARQSDCSGGPTLITTYNGSPTPYGASVKEFYTAHSLFR